MTINMINDGKKATFQLEGRLDTVTAPDLDKEFNDNVDSFEDVVFDFSQLAYISSAGLRVLLSAQKTMNKKGSMKIVNASEEVKEVFEITGFSDIMTIE